LWVDAVEKVGGTALARNNRIPGDDFLNQSCAFTGRLESMLLGAPSKSFFNSIGQELRCSAGGQRVRFTPPMSGHDQQRATNPTNPTNPMGLERSCSVRAVATFSVLDQPFALQDCAERSARRR
jgi:hypothetical protein